MNEIVQLCLNHPFWAVFAITWPIAGALAMMMICAIAVRDFPERFVVISPSYHASAFGCGIVVGWILYLILLSVFYLDRPFTRYRGMIFHLRNAYLEAGRLLEERAAAEVARAATADGSKNVVPIHSNRKVA